MNNDSPATIADTAHTLAHNMPSSAISTVTNDTFINDAALSDEPKKKGKWMKYILI